MDPWTIVALIIAAAFGLYQLLLVVLCLFFVTRGTNARISMVPGLVAILILLIVVLI